ncbi:TetR/AcrR family transcriptional regulator [Frondihabitans australicus]|uniref:TetR family transcriptional regulator n=1 Tax=Frondihabitans australicus TaxID=386892 RepID=A0A495IKR3_9MICO|nr:TetR family transcriptional regulator [Frondihabitans australicus]RKR76567.1 TetR family transcriptional regulator [Frondihabitans australicus]
MDPRAQRSRDRLTRAVLAFADAGRLDDVSVSELAREAEVTRDTFYRHASSVTDLLTIAIGEKLEEFGAAAVTEMPPRSELAAVLRASEPALLQHIVDHANIYRTALAGDNAAPVYRTLLRFLAGNIATGLRAYPDIAPLPPEQMDDTAILMVSTYSAAGFVAAVREWLMLGDLSDIDRAGEIIAASAPEWWRRATGRV